MSVFDLPYQKLKNVILITALVFSTILVIIILTFFYKSNNIPQILKGLLFGVVASLLNFQLLAKKTESVVDAKLNERKNNNSNKKKSNSNEGIAEILKGYFLRYFIIAAVLVAASLKKNEINIIATIVG
ncbi:MAG TPA: ATP synthase subunit I, partial [bacterium]|nr:ATP synthase subunit I [bacterium]